MKLRKNKQTFESLSKQVYELRSQIESDKLKLAETLALLEQYKVDTEVTLRCIKDELGVSPMFAWQADLSV